MQFMAYATRPTAVPIPGIDFWRIVGWEKLGPATGMEGAKRRYGGSPVLEAVK